MSQQKSIYEQINSYDRILYYKNTNHADLLMCLRSTHWHSTGQKIRPSPPPPCPGQQKFDKYVRIVY